MASEAYAYIDKTANQVFHVLIEYEDARKHAKGSIIEYKGEHECGYPVVDGKQLVVYTRNMMEKHDRSIPSYVQAAIDALR
ncbi:hypothetical protein ACE3MZ_15970 [Paenibacillus sp. WLX1005]|uniref:hypothetical protein n=1 Tax=Paenibacillus sp. WLX1005 TaxID=3243766 RepID=UPI0039845E88